MRTKAILLSACKMLTLDCIGKNHDIADDSFCKWPKCNTTGCTNCHMWEFCDGRNIQACFFSVLKNSICNLFWTRFSFFLFFFLDQTNKCRCKDTADCSNPGIILCVRVGEDRVNQTMSECEAGLKRCKGEKVSVVGILSCPAWGLELITTFLYIPLCVTPQ